MTQLDIISGFFGAKHQSGASTNTESIAFLETTSETTFGVINENGEEADVAGTYLKGGLTIPANVKIRPGNDGHFSSVAITSGSYSYVLKGR